MMKSWWSRLCFLVLAISSLSRGQTTSAVPQHDKGHDDKEDSPGVEAQAPTELPLAETRNEAVLPTSTPPSPQSNTTVNATDQSTAAFMTREVEEEEDTPTTDDERNLTMTDDGNATAPVSVPGGGREGDTDDTMTTVSTATHSTSSKSAPTEGDDHSSWGYVILVLIILVIIALCVILYILRRVSRTYSFDLQRPVPINHLDEPTGTFEPVYLDDLDRPAPKDQVTSDDLSPPPAANGTTLQSEEKVSSGENGSQEQPDANGLETSLTSNTSAPLGDDPAEKTPSPLSSTNLFFDAIVEEQQNENNNNPSVSSSEPFVEIDLDDPAWCDQLLTSPEAPSSVLPFSPFSFSSSSSS